MITILAAGLFVEAGVVGVVCLVFLILFVVAGIRQIIKDKEENER
jgi:O-antigen ligase